MALKIVAGYMPRFLLYRTRQFCNLTDQPRSLDIPERIRTLLRTRSVHYSTTMASQEYVVGHDKKKCEFYITLPDNHSEKAVLQYEMTQGSVMDMYHTGVPTAFRGQGIAKILAKEALDYVVKTDGKMMLSCTYLQKYLKDNPLPQYTDRVVNS